MKYYELKVNVRLKQDIHFKDSLITLNTILNKFMMLNEFLKSIHQHKGYKFYNYSSFYPVEEDVYYEGELYFFTLRSCRKRIVKEFEKVLQNDNPFFYVIESEFIVKNQYNLNGLYALTPVVMTYPNIKEDRYWKNEKPIQDLIKAINMNLQKKYKDFTGIDIDRGYNMIEQIIITNQNPIGVKYKGGSIIGAKTKIILKQEKIAQDLAFFALGIGLLEKNSLGFGFCIPLKEKVGG